MTSYNGQTLTYDAIGNPLNYRDGITLTWQNGRELASFSNSSYDITYTYDASGMRTSKDIEGVGTVSYVYENGKLLQMDYLGYIFTFSYDVNGNPIGFELNNDSEISYYYYGLNSRGDVIAIYDESGLKIATYTYDAYGKFLNRTYIAGSITYTDTVATTYNPLRYRGYVYDIDTGFYYLQSRYYDPTTCRFVNADSQLNADSANGFNMFAYCNGNPVMMTDPNGTDAIVLYDSDGNAHIGALVQDKNYNWWHFYWGANDKVFPMIATIFGGNTDADTWCKAYSGALDLSSINENGGYPWYDKSTYLYGDFSSCVTTFKNPDDKYNLYNNNCSQFTLKTLASADTIYKDVLYTASSELYPATAFYYVRDNSPTPPLGVGLISACMNAVRILLRTIGNTKQN